MAAIPRQVSVMGLPFQVRLVDSDKILLETHNPEALAAISTHRGIIWIDRDSTEEVQQASLLHEVIHAINNSLNLNMTEEAICALGVLLRDFLVGNRLWLPNNPQERAGGEQE